MVDGCGPADLAVIAVTTRTSPSKYLEAIVLVPGGGAIGLSLRGKIRRRSRRSRLSGSPHFSNTECQDLDLSVRQNSRLARRNCRHAWSHASFPCAAFELPV